MFPLPYFDQPHLPLGPLTIHAFGALVATGVLVGSEVMRRRAMRQDLDPVLATRLVTWVLVSAFIGAHLVDRLIYFPAETWADPWSIVKIWQGISSFGGFLGAIFGAWFFIHRGHLKEKVWSYLDTVAYAFPIGWLFGRTGCFLAFDHPGKETDFFLAQYDRENILRHNLGLDEAIYTVAIIALFLILGRKPRFPGFFVTLFPMVYAPFRFFLDFLRARDVRYFDLTPGQWGAIAVLALGIFMFRRQKKRAQTVTAG